MVLPQLTPNGLAEVVSALPPRGFRPLRGTPTHVSRLKARFASSEAPSAAQRNGLRYEAKVQWFLRTRLGIEYHMQVPFSFRDSDVPRLVVPDGILLRSRDVVIFEIKSQHMPEAWWQLRRLYAPVLEAWWNKPVVCCEVVKSFDPSIGFPEPVKFCRSLDEVLSSNHGDAFRVFQWR